MSDEICGILLMALGVILMAISVYPESNKNRYLHSNEINIRNKLIKAVKLAEDWSDRCLMVEDRFEKKNQLDGAIIFDLMQKMDKKSIIVKTKLPDGAHLQIVVLPNEEAEVFINHVGNP